jgi:nucleoside-diphosphate-sugar epimerase
MKTDAKLLVTGGAGYIGSVLVPHLLAQGYRTTVFDCLLFGDKPLAAVRGNPNLEVIAGDLRDAAAVRRLLEEGRFDAVIQLGAISNDPSSELDPELTRDVNLRALEVLMPEAKRTGVQRFLYASSASVYGIKSDPDVTEELPLEPLTLYARYKAEGEAILNALCDEDFCGVSVRAATVCGYSPRLRLDLTINILTEHAVRRGAIRVFGGEQLRPNIHIQDLVDFYSGLLTADRNIVNGRAFNVSAENASVMELAERIRAVVNPELPIEVVPTDDQRSYHLSAARAADELGFHPRHALDEAIRDVAGALTDGRVPNADSPWYRNVEWMKRHPEFWRLAAEEPA